MTNQRRPIKHGTTAGYKAHWNRGEKACNACKLAWRMKYARKRTSIRRAEWVRLTPEEKQALIEIRAEAEQAREYLDWKKERERDLHPAVGAEGAVQAEGPVGLPGATGEEGHPGG